MDVRGKRVAVTGGYGFIGQHLLRALSEVGATPIALVHGDDAAADVPGEHRIVDLRDRDAVAESVEGTDLVVHLAARSGGIQFQGAAHRQVLDENMTMTRNVLDAAAEADVRRVFLASSGVVYSRHVEGELTEDRPVVSPAGEFVTGYAWSKLTDEALGFWAAGEAAIEVVVGRFTNVYGPGGSFTTERSTVVHALIKKAVENSPEGALRVWGDGTPVRTFIYVEDAAQAIITALTHGEPGEVYNISTSRSVSIRELAEEIRVLVSPAMELVFEPERPQGPQRRALDGSKLAAIGFRASVTLQEGLHRTISWYDATRNRV